MADHTPTYEEVGEGCSLGEIDEASLLAAVFVAEHRGFCTNPACGDSSLSVRFVSLMEPDELADALVDAANRVRTVREDAASAG